MYRLEILPVALANLSDIAHYIAFTLHNPTSADRITDEILDSLEKLRSNPHICQVYEEVDGLQQEYRRLVVGKYVVFYWIEEEKNLVTVAHICYGATDYKKYLM